MARSSRRTAIFYVLAAVATVMGVRLMFAGRDEPHDPMPDTGRSTVVIDRLPALRSGRGGYLGSGRAQVTVEGGARPVAETPAPSEDHSVQTRQDMDGERRAEELKRVLSNIDGEPVYVEGVDGPAPAKRKR